VPTFFRSVSFLNDWHALSPDEKRQFKTAVRQMVDDLRTKQGFRRQLRIKRANSQRRFRDDMDAGRTCDLPVRPGSTSRRATYHLAAYRWSRDLQESVMLIPD
jgi:hypothetical protein